ncbi:SH3 domain-containing protein [Leptolyngbya sp. FACHB-36]|nr:SH3 domain-containing protein [Leptolyngbya sp. FACHB-36]
MLAAAALPALADMATILAAPGTRVNVRQSPSTTSRIRHYGLGGDRVTILNQTNAPDGFPWYFVEFPNSGARGWLRGDLLLVNAASSERVSFAPGTSAATVGGRVQGSESREYVLKAGAGQTMTTRITGTSSFLQVQVVAPNGSTVYTGSRNWSGVLRSAGDYRVRVRLVPEEQRSGASGEYSLTIAIR